MESRKQIVSAVFTFLFGAAFAWLLLNPSPIQLFGTASPVAAQSKSNQVADEFDMSELNSILERVLKIAEADMTVDNREILDRAQALGTIAAVSAAASLSLNSRYNTTEQSRTITDGDTRLAQLERKKQELLAKRETILKKPAARSLTSTKISTQKIDTELEEIDKAIQQTKQSTEEAQELLNSSMQTLELMMQMESRIYNSISNVMKVRDDAEKSIIKNKK
jgi:hypothetical protein